MIPCFSHSFGPGYSWFSLVCLFLFGWVLVFCCKAPDVITAEDQALNMMSYRATFRVSVNGEASKGALATMLVNDMQTYDSVIPAGSSVDMVSIVEVPQGTNPNTIDFILRGGEQDGTLHLQ